MRNFLILLTIILCFNSQSLFSQRNSIKSESDFKSYFDKKSNSIDLIEGIYNLKIVTNVSNINRYSGVQNNTPFITNTTCIIYKTGTKFQVYIYDSKSDYSYITTTASSTKFLFTYDEKNQDLKDMELYFEDKATLKCIHKFRKDEGHPVYADITWDVTFTKIYPTSSDYQSITESTQKSTGTGFAISSNGYIVTNYHVIENANSIKVRGVNADFSNSLLAKVISSDRNNDLAIIQINDGKFTDITNIPYVIRTNSVDVGEDVFVLGYPLTSSMGDEIKLTTGIISAKSGFQGDITTYQMTAPIQPGNSGAPVFDKNGLLVAITNAKHTQAENAGYAIKTNYLRNLIESLPTNVTFQSTNLLQNKPLPEQVKVLKKFVYIIEIN